MDQSSSAVPVTGTFQRVPSRPPGVGKIRGRGTALAGLYRAARVGLVTPLRDGMNLVAKEYISAQDAEDPGVLILSRFAGAAAECRDALLVNPFDAESVASAIARALEMPLSERRDRYNHIIQTLSLNSSDVWGARFLRSLEQLELVGTNAEFWERLAYQQ
jgi:trehalose 6-phosphate synthase